jgi:hypothetical protein
MKLAKLSILAGFVVLLATALASQSAMAETTVLCKVDESPCAQANWVKSVHFVAENIQIEPEYAYSCDALLSAEALGLGSPQVLDVTSLVYTNCTGGCTRKLVKAGTLKVLRTGKETAEVKGEGGEILVECSGGGFNCLFDLGGTAGQLSGPLLTGTTAHLTYNKALLHKIGGLFCPTNVALSALFEALETFYVSS